MDIILSISVKKARLTGPAGKGKFLILITNMCTNVTPKQMIEIDTRGPYMVTF